jgi:DNA (cytosine-5)-methyltransferase 1
MKNGQTAPFLTPTHSEGGQHGLPAWTTFRDAMIGLNGAHEHVNFSEKRLKFYKMLKAGQYWKHLPSEEIKQEAMGRSYFAGGGKTGFYRRLGWDTPSPTLVTHPAMPATDLSHPVENRPLSIQEYMRLQQFPDDWQLSGKLLDRYRQVGNAVPVGLGHAVGKLLVEVLGEQKNNFTEYPDFKFSRYKNTDHINWRKNLKLENPQEKMVFI